MTIDWSLARAWAELHAQHWFESARPPLAVNGIEIGWPLQIEAFEAFLRVATTTAGLASEGGGLSPMSMAKRHGHDRALRAWAMRPMTLGSASDPKTAPVLFVNEIPTPSMIEPSIRVANAIPRNRVAVASADPRVMRRWRASGYTPIALNIPWREEWRLIRNGRREAAREWHRYVGGGPRFEFAGHDVTEAALAQLGPLVRNAAPWLAVELRALQRTIDRVRPRVIAVATDQHRIGRLTTLAAAGRADVAVLQHGLPQTPIAFLPVVADLVCVWSNGVRDWFVNGGTAADRVAVVGNPRLDLLSTLDRRQARARLDADYAMFQARHVLVPLSPLGAETNMRVLEITLDAARADPDLAAIVKLHPGQGESREVRKRVRGAALGTRLKLLRHEPLPRLLLWADATFVYRSTVALESLAASTPVIAADIGPASIADDELAGLGLPRASTGAELAELVRGLTTDEGRRHYLAGRARALDHMTGPRDGKAAQRAAQLLLGCRDEAQELTRSTSSSVRT